MDFAQLGQHQDAWAAWDDAIACDPHPYNLQLAFMQACAVGDSPRAKHYHKRLTPAQQTRFAQVCIRQKPPVAYQ